MSEYVIIARGFASGAPCNHEGMYLQNFDHDAFNGQGWGTFTPKRSRARRFADQLAAIDFWKQQSTVRPLRPDGEPNRPMTALTVEIAPLED